jgi:putative phosphoribosyl transferase
VRWALELHGRGAMTWRSSEWLADRRFADRRDAGRLLAAALMQYAGTEPVVLGLPRGGVPVAEEVARRLGGTLDVWIARKLGVPGHEELGMGAVAEGPAVVIDHHIVDPLCISREQILAVAHREIAELQRRVHRFRPDGAMPRLAGKTVILVDDGIATGGTVRAAIRGVKKAGPARVVLAVPVAPPETVAALRSEVDDLVCLHQPSELVAIGLWYDDFHQVPDEEVERILERWRGHKPEHARA